MSRFEQPRPHNSLVRQRSFLSVLAALQSICKSIQNIKYNYRHQY